MLLIALALLSLAAPDGHYVDRSKFRQTVTASTSADRAIAEDASGRRVLAVDTPAAQAPALANISAKSNTCFERARRGSKMHAFGAALTIQGGLTTLGSLLIGASIASADSSSLRGSEVSAAPAVIGGVLGVALLVGGIALLSAGDEAYDCAWS